MAFSESVARQSLRLSSKEVGRSWKELGEIWISKPKSVTETARPDSRRRRYHRLCSVLINKFYSYALNEIGCRNLDVKIGRRENSKSDNEVGRKAATRVSERRCRPRCIQIALFSSDSFESFYLMKDRVSCAASATNSSLWIRRNPPPTSHALREGLRDREGGRPRNAKKLN